MFVQKPAVTITVSRVRGRLRPEITSIVAQSVATARDKRYYAPVPNGDECDPNECHDGRFS
jgi:hypothetical protein